MDKNQDYFNENVANAQKEIFGGRFVLNESLSKKFGLKVYDDTKETERGMHYVLDWGECYTEEEIAENLKDWQSIQCLEIGE